MAGQSLNQPTVGIAATPDGKGYWLVAQDGGIFAFGDATFEGSLPQTGIPTDDIVAFSTTGTGQGYWLAGGDGAVYAFGDAPFKGPAA
ncbi:MAG TPA: hypothetical protein VHB02_02985 [Acidimicrobiales bacterium]|nr:hypothetical protein [Acidimicrobiales bacterium]